MRARFAVAALWFAVAGAILLFFAPSYSGYGASRSGQATLIGVSGPWILVPIFFPVLLALLPVAFHIRACTLQRRF